MGFFEILILEILAAGLGYLFGRYSASTKTRSTESKARLIEKRMDQHLRKIQGHIRRESPEDKDLVEVIEAMLNNEPMESVLKKMSPKRRRAYENFVKSRARQATKIRKEQDGN